MRPGRLTVTTSTALVLLVGCIGLAVRRAATGNSSGQLVLAVDRRTIRDALPEPQVLDRVVTFGQAAEPGGRRGEPAQALVTATDLGKPWVQSDRPPDSDETCPGTQSAVARLAFRAAAHRDLTRGAGELVNGANFQLASLPSPDAAKVWAAWDAATRACRQYTDTDDYYVVYSFLTSECDPDATDFTEATKLLQTQLAKAAQAFAR